MLDLKFIVQNPNIVKKACIDKHEKDNIDQILDLNRMRKIYVSERDSIRKKLNGISGEIGKLAKQKIDIGSLKTEAAEISAQVKSVEEKLRFVEENLGKLLLTVPNIPHPDVPIGESENDNKFIRDWGKPREFDFEPLNHLELNEKLKIFDSQRGAKITGSFFPIFTGQGAKLVRALVDFMLDLHTSTGKYTEIFPPYLVNRASMLGTAQLPKLENDMYHLDDEDYFLIPTGEVPMTNFHRGETLTEDELPKYYCGYTACFRREAGSYGKDTKGLMRLHQFDKIELVKIVYPDNSFDELEDLLSDAEKVLQKLELHYRVIILCTADLTFGSAKTYDIELWSPGSKKWLEVSSVSNLTDFQARRMNTRFRSKTDNKLHYVHTLNGSGVALPRLIIALLETYQNADGTVGIPSALANYFGSDIIIDT
ncbi:serine--tRNA ligase [bacterium]|nr:serine--tRNA ligase [bacterium]